MSDDGCTDCMNYGWDDVLTNMNPYMWGQLGLAIALTFSVIGAAWGIWSTGATLLGGSVKAPRIRSKNLVSIIFCEASAIYGVIMAIYLINKIGTLKDKSYTYPADDSFNAHWYFAGYGIFWSGMTLGLANCASAIATGIAGSSVALADAQDGSLFSKVLVCEIFASALAIFALVTAFTMSSALEFPES
mmetsp:Transcript_17626/g.35327  ORF Transcript_17626/g.35327 Transcript_17626/m.35327 type:complete len:189 (-) Transcript_17626:59-625(-)